MSEVYSSLFKGKVHVTTPYSEKHKALDLGNYKCRNKIYSPTKFGTGKVTKYTTSYTYNKILYKNVATIWYTYSNGWVMVLVHGEPKDQVVKVGDTVKVGQQIYVTGNKGYSKGDHLHVQLTKKGIYKDPANYVLNDKPVIIKPITTTTKTQVQPTATVVTTTESKIVVPEAPTTTVTNETTEAATEPRAEIKKSLEIIIQFFTDLLQRIKSD